MKKRKMQLFGWYPQREKSCKNAILEYEDMYKNVQTDRSLGGVVPHAGWTYSGKLAAVIVRLLAENQKEKPDTIVIYGNSAQIMRLVQAVRRGPEGPGNVNAVATGSSDCGDIAARTLLSGECQFILPSGGDRVFGSTQDHEVIFTIPKAMVDAVLKGLESTHKAGFRYPVLADLRHRPNLPPNLEIPKEAV